MKLFAEVFEQIFVISPAVKDADKLLGVLSVLLEAGCVLMVSTVLSRAVFPVISALISEHLYPLF